MVPSSAPAVTAHAASTTVEPLAVVVERRVAAAMGGASPLLRRSDRADFQANGVLPLAKANRQQSAALAAEIAARIPVDDVVLACRPSGPGFLNITVSDAALLRNLAARAADARLGVAPKSEPGVTVIDYSSPNIAKEMHVGHIRSTVIGDALARVLAFTGETVVRRNHLGDWGTSFGMLIQQLAETTGLAGDMQVPELSDVYQQARARFDADPDFAERARLRVVALQSGDTETVAAWQRLVATSRRYFARVYAELGVLLEDADALGESHYNPMLAQVCADLERAGIAVPSDGALCVFPPDGAGGADGADGADSTGCAGGAAGSEGLGSAPLIVRKGDGGYGYAATDLAAVRDRVDGLGATRLLYLVDARQARHFAQVFDTARRAGWLPSEVTASHLAFGTILGPDGRPFKTRSGDTVRLQDLIDQAVAAARAIVVEKNPDLAPDELEARSRQVGIGALKYADLSNNRVKDYVFDPARMVSLTGDTATYLQYAHARMRSVLRKAGVTAVPAVAGVPAAGASVALEPAERALGLLLDEFGAAVDAVAESCEPHRLCSYLSALASAFSTFWEQCPVLKAENPAVRDTRLLLCTLSARTLAQGMDLLGIEAPERL